MGNNPLNAHAGNFCWPTEADLKNLNLSEPLQLKEVRTDGVQNYFMTAIQFVFTNGVESPLIDSKHPGSTGLSSFVIPDKPIRRILSRVHGSVYL